MIFRTSLWHQPFAILHQKWLTCAKFPPSGKPNQVTVTFTVTVTFSIRRHTLNFAPQTDLGQSGALLADVQNVSYFTRTDQQISLHFF